MARTTYATTAATLMFLCLTGCGLIPKSPDKPKPTPTPVPSPLPTPTPTPVVQTLFGKFDVSSTTATGVTGPLTITRGRFKFEYQDFAVGAPSDLDPKSTSPTGMSWAEFMIVPNTAKIQLWPVTSEKVAPNAPNGSICPQGAPRFLVTATPDNYDPHGLQIAVFSSEEATANLAGTEMCGTFGYSLFDAKKPTPVPELSEMPVNAAAPVDPSRSLQE